MGLSSVEAIETRDIDYQSLQSPQHQEAPYIHKVGVPPKQNSIDEFKTVVKETLFWDDPLRSFKDQTGSRKFVLGLQATFPILDWGHWLCKARKLSSALWTILQLCPAFDYAFMGSSRDIAIGLVAVVSLLLGSLLSGEVDPTTHPNEYRRLAFTATFFPGITHATLGILRLGFLVDFLSHAAVVGFMGGAAITITLQQLKAFLGIKKFTKETDIISVMKSVPHSAHHGENR